MGNKKNKQLIIIGVMLLAACFVVYRPAATSRTTKPVPLSSVLGPVPGYQQISSSRVDDDIARFLELDDYTQSSYTRDGARISLFIGYYFSLQKLSSAHSPLVCFPSQGWQLEQKKEGTLELPETTIRYAEMAGERGDSRELIIYWYQAHQKTAPQVYRNKINGVFNKLTGQKGEHAFVRVTVPYENGKKQQAEQAAQQFMKSFYPVFVGYIDS